MGLLRVRRCVGFARELKEVCDQDMINGVSQVQADNNEGPYCGEVELVAVVVVEATQKNSTRVVERQDAVD